MCQAPKILTQKTVAGVVTSYVYNIEDRLVEVWSGDAGSGSLVAEYYYDPFGRRLWKEVSGVRTYFHYSDEGLIGEYDATGAEIKTYGYKPGSTWTTDPLFVKENGQYYFYSNDQLGTPQKMTTVNGAIVWSAKYSSFGKATIEVETVENNLRFPGQYYDTESGLHYNYHRYYAQEVGRYSKSDPIKLSGGINFFVYAMNNPLRNIDPEGLFCGPGVIGDVVIPDSPEGYDFSKCCRKHDNCYGKQCKKSKTQCDNDFYDCMKRVCDLRYLVSKECYKWASIYWDAVDSDLGEWAFDNAREGEPCKQCNN